MDFTKLRIGQKVKVLADQHENFSVDKPLTVAKGEIVTITVIFTDSVKVKSDATNKEAYCSPAEFELLPQDLSEASKIAILGAFRAQGFHVEEIIRLAQAGIV